MTTRPTPPAQDEYAQLTDPKTGVRIAVSLRYYQHPRGMLATTADANEGAVYQAHGYKPITAKQHAAAVARRDREDAKYERKVKQLTRKYER